MATKPVTVPHQVDPGQRYTISESCAVLRQSRSKTYQDIQCGDLRVIRDRSRVYVPGSELIRRATLPSE